MVDIHEGLTRKEKNDLMIENEMTVYAECSVCGLLAIGEGCYEVIETPTCS